MGDTNAIPTGVWIRAELVRELSAEVYDYPAGFPDTPLLAAARAVVDAVEFEDEAGPIVITREELLSEVNAEKAWHHWAIEVAPMNRSPHDAFLAGYAAHMAAPDELTAALASRNLARARQDEIADELTALRERINAAQSVIDRWTGWLSDERRKEIRRALDGGDA